MSQGFCLTLTMSAERCWGEVWATRVAKGCFCDGIFTCIGISASRHFLNFAPRTGTANPCQPKFQNFPLADQQPQAPFSNPMTPSPKNLYPGCTLDQTSRGLVRRGLRRGSQGLAWASNISRLLSALRPYSLQGTQNEANQRIGPLQVGRHQTVAHEKRGFRTTSQAGESNIILLKERYCCQSGSCRQGGLASGI